MISNREIKTLMSLSTKKGRKESGKYLIEGFRIESGYISNSFIHPTEGKVVVHELMADAMVAYIYWKSIYRKRAVPPTDKEDAKRSYYNEKRLARARMLSFTKDEALQTTRKAFKQSPKM